MILGPSIATRIRRDMRAWLRRQWDTTDRIKRDLEDPVEATMVQIFEEQKEEAIKAVRGTERAIDVVLTAELLLNIAEWLIRTELLVSPLLLDAIITGFKTGAFRIDFSGPDITSQDPDVLAALRALNGKMRGVTITTVDELATLVQDALMEGWSVDQVAQAIDDKFDEFKAVRARRIAVTSVTTGFEAGQYASFRRAGIRASRWLSERDGRVRATHDHITGVDGQERPIGVPFNVGKDLLLHPGDPNGSARETVNCRCTLLPLR